MPDHLLYAVLCSLLLGYAVGCLSPAFVIGKLKGYDVRKTGSKNAGATNTMLMAGKLAGVLVAMTDIVKAACSWWLSAALFPGVRVAGMIGGAACTLGHIYPLPLRFRGGKGLACMGGVILAYEPKTLLMMLAIALTIGLITNYLAVVTVSIAAIWPLYYGVATGFWPGAAILAVPLIPITIRHLENFRRMKAGTELRLSYLWDKEAELRRTGHQDEDKQINA